MLFEGLLSVEGFVESDFETAASKYDDLSITSDGALRRPAGPARLDGRAIAIDLLYDKAGVGTKNRDRKKLENPLLRNKVPVRLQYYRYIVQSN